MAKKVPKASKRRLVFLSPFIMVIVVYFLFTVGYYGYKLISLKSEQEKLNKDLYTLQTQEQQLSNEIQKLKDPEYLARYARENFLYSKDGEYIIRLEDNKEIVPESNSFLDLIEQNFLYIIIGFSLLIVAFIFIIFKKNKKRN